MELESIGASKKLTNFLTREDYSIINKSFLSDEDVEELMLWLDDASNLIETMNTNLILHIETMGERIFELIGTCNSELWGKAGKVLKSLVELSPEDGVPVLATALHHESWKIVEGALVCLEALTSESQHVAYISVLPRVRELQESNFEPLRFQSRETIKGFNIMYKKMGRDLITFKEIKLLVCSPHDVEYMPKPSTPQSSSPNNGPKKPNGYKELEFLNHFKDMVISSAPTYSPTIDDQLKVINNKILNRSYIKKHEAFKSLFKLVKETGEYFKLGLNLDLSKNLSMAIIDPDFEIASLACVAVIVISVHVDPDFASDVILSSISSLLYDTCKSSHDLGVYALRRIAYNVHTESVFKEILKLFSSKYSKIRRVAVQLFLPILSDWPLTFLLQNKNVITGIIDKCEEDKDILQSELNSFNRHVSMWSDSTPTSQQELWPHFSCVESASEIIKLARLWNVCCSHVENFPPEQLSETLMKLERKFNEGCRSSEEVEKIETGAKELHGQLKDILLKGMQIDKCSLEMEAGVQTSRKVFSEYHAGALIFSPFLDRIVLVESKGGLTGFPKGTSDCLELGELESPEFTAQREVAEESKHLIKDFIDRRAYIDVKVKQSELRLYLVLDRQPCDGAIQQREGDLTSDVKVLATPNEILSGTLELNGYVRDVLILFVKIMLGELNFGSRLAFVPKLEERPQIGT